MQYGLGTGLRRYGVHWRERAERASTFTVYHNIEIRDVYEPVFSLHGQASDNNNNSQCILPACYQWSDEKYTVTEEAIRDSLRRLGTKEVTEKNVLVGLAKLIADGKVLKSMSTKVIASEYMYHTTTAT